MMINDASSKNGSLNQNARIGSRKQNTIGDPMDTGRRHTATTRKK